MEEASRQMALDGFIRSGHPLESWGPSCAAVAMDSGSRFSLLPLKRERENYLTRARVHRDER